MTDQYTPTTDEVRRSFVYAESSDFVATVPGTGVDSWARVPAQGYIRVTRVRNGEIHKAATAEFDRWLAEVERAAAEKAWAEAIKAFRVAELDWESYLGWKMEKKPIHPYDLVNPYRKTVQS